jgi:hypothetical protein
MSKLSAQDFEYAIQEHKPTFSVSLDHIGKNFSERPLRYRQEYLKLYRKTKKVSMFETIMISVRGTLRSFF